MELKRRANLMGIIMNPKQFTVVCTMLCVVAGVIYAQEKQSLKSENPSFATLIESKLRGKEFKLRNWPGVYVLKEVGDGYISYENREQLGIISYLPLSQVTDLSYYEKEDYFALSMGVDALANVVKRLDVLKKELESISGKLDRTLDLEFESRTRGDNSKASGTLKVNAR